MSSDVGELRGDAKEELVLLAERLLLVSRQVSALFCLKGHVGVRDLGEWREEEDHGKEEDEGRDADVGPLDVREVGRVGVLEEDSRGQKRCHDRADGLEGLGELQTEFGQSGGSTGRNVRVGGRFEGRESTAHDEQAATEAGEGLVDCRGPEHQGTDSVDAKPRHEGDAVSESSHDPARIREGADEVSAKV